MLPTSPTAVMPLKGSSLPVNIVWSCFLAVGYLSCCLLSLWAQFKFCCIMDQAIEVLQN